jgi:parvulin-like peptidyl-prolyl isomerase
MAGRQVLVNGEAIPDEEIRAEAALLRKDLESRGVELTLEQRLELRERATETLIERYLVFQECRRLGLSPSAREIEEAARALTPRMDGVAGCRAGTDLTEFMREAKRRLIFERMIALWCAALRPPKSTEVRDYYRSHREQFRRPATVHASHLVRHKEGRDSEEVQAEMNAVRQRLLSGEAFAALAATCSDCPENDGDLGFFARGIMVEEFDQVVFAAPLHEATPVFETRFGWHVAIVHDRRPEGIMELDEAAGPIAEALYRNKRDREVGRQLDALRRKAEVRVSG